MSPLQRMGPEDSREKTGFLERLSTRTRTCINISYHICIKNNIYIYIYTHVHMFNYMYINLFLQTAVTKISFEEECCVIV